MTIKTWLKGHTSTANAPGTDDQWAERNPGPYIGIVKNNIDPLKMGRLQVNIPSLSKTNDPVTGNLIICEYLSPFYGNKDINYNIPGDTNYSSSQHSYGFWAVPPDLGTRVLVIFAEGNMDQAFWIGCVQEPITNHMIPGIAASEKTWDKKDSGGPAGKYSSDIDKEKTYGTLVVPAGELNRTSGDPNPAKNYDKTNKPIHPLADVLAYQGLSTDDVRGTTTSSARRETPSQVFGLSTPGPKDVSSTPQPVGTKDVRVNDHVTRGIGHTFVMDDGDEQGENQLTRLRTASGHQLLMHDTEGVVYLANGTGTSWFEMSPEGKIYIYAQDGFNLRADGDFDLHSGGNMTFHAANDIRFTSEGSIVHNAEFYLMGMGKKGIFQNSEEGSFRMAGRDGISSYTEGTQLHGAGGQVHLAGSQVHFNSVEAADTWGPNWLTPDATGIFTDDSQNDVNITVGEGEILEANTAETKTTVSQLVTHEPFVRAPSGIIEDTSQWQDEEEWEKLSKTPGTKEYMAQKNRESKNKRQRQLQYLADQAKYVSENNVPKILRGKKIFRTQAVTMADSIEKKFANNKNLNKKELKFLTDTGLYNPRDAYRTGLSAKDSYVANASTMLSKYSRQLGISDKNIKKMTKELSGWQKQLKDMGYATGGTKSASLNNAKKLADGFAGKYNKIYKVATVLPNLSKENIGSFLINKVTGGSLTSVSIPQLKVQAAKHIFKNAGKFFSKGSANNVPPSMRDEAKGRIMQAANTVKDGISRAFGSIFHR
jgi:hypothetical protein